MSKFQVSITISGPCILCGTPDNTPASFILADEDMVDVKQALVKKQDMIAKEFKRIMCDECFMRDKLKLPDGVLSDIVSSSSSETQ